MTTHNYPFSGQKTHKNPENQVMSNGSFGFVRGQATPSLLSNGFKQLPTSLAAA